MPSISAILLVALAGVGAQPYPAERADYRAAFDDSADVASSDAWPQAPSNDHRAAPASKPARLPIHFRPVAHLETDNTAPSAGEKAHGATGALTAEGRAIPLAPPSPDSERSVPRLPTASIPTVAGSLAAVVGLFMIVAWIMRRGMPKGSGILPREVVEVLGRAPLAGRQQLQLLRLGNKLLLVSMSATSVEPLAEITDPLEVDRLTGLCYQTHPQGSTASFRQVFQSFEGAGGGYPVRPVDRLDLSQLDAIASGAKGKEGPYGR